MQVCVAVIGAGRMGTVIAKQLPKDTRKIIIDTDLEKAGRLAVEVEGEAANSLEKARQADLTAVVLPAPAVNSIIGELLDAVGIGAVIINMATAAQVEEGLLAKARVKGVQVVDAKIIGHAMSISKGEPGIVVVKTQDQDMYSLIKSQLPGFDDVVQGDADLVAKINVIGSTEGIRAAVNVRKQLRKMDVPEEWINVVIRTVCAGTMKSFAENDLGHFAMELVKELEEEN